MRPRRNWRYLVIGLSSVALAALGCSEESESSEPLGQVAEATYSECGWVPDEYIDQQDGCDCPLNGNTECDADCEHNGEGSWCGCDYCFDASGNEVTEPPSSGGGESCELVPEEYLDAGDGCDCPADGDLSCDADCDSGNTPSGYCGCQYCYPEDPPPDEEEDPDPPPGGEECAAVPEEYIDEQDGCDCPATGDLSCDPDCEDENAGGGYCGCQYCYPEDPPPDEEEDPDPPPGGEECAAVPEEYIDEQDGCDCPATGDLSCDPDCEDENAGGGYCGCEYCHPEEPSDGGSGEPGEIHTITLELPEGASLCELHLYAAENLTLSPNVTGAGAVVGWSGASVGANASVQALASDGPVTVASGATVSVASGSSLSGSVERFIAHQESHAREQATWQVLIPPGTTANVEASTTSNLPPGRYGHVDVPSGTTLSLSPGAYYFESLELSAGGGLVLLGEGSSVLHVLDAVSFAGEVQRAPNAQLVLIYLGDQDLVLESSLEGTLVAPFVALELARPDSGAHAGAFFAKDLTVASNTALSRLPANALVPHFASDLERCARHVCGVDLSDERQRELALALHCLEADDVCEAEMQAIANVDYRVAAARVVTREFTPGRYQAVSRDRSRKLRIARATAGYHCAVTSGDADADLVPDGSDECPGTPELTPTDDEGCPEPIPPGPDADQVSAILDQMNVSVASHCGGARPPAPGDLSAIWSMEPDLTFSFDFDDGQNCPVFYELKFERRYALVTDANGVPLSDVLQFMAPPDSVGTAGPGRVRLTFAQATEVAGVAQARGFAHQSTHLYLRYRVRSITPNGTKSPWSQWSSWTFKEY